MSKINRGSYFCISKIKKQLAHKLGGRKPFLKQPLKINENIVCKCLM
jgi:hypothetical protein